jgi:hypothetical protein
MKNKKLPAVKKLKQGNISRQKAKLLLRSGGELEEMMLGSIQEKMQKGSEAKRVVKSSSGGEKMQAYKMGGWTSSE